MDEQQGRPHLGAVEATGSDTVPVKSAEDEERPGAEPRAHRPQREEVSQQPRAQSKTSSPTIPQKLFLPDPGGWSELVRGVGDLHGCLDQQEIG